MLLKKLVLTLFLVACFPLIALADPILQELNGQEIPFSSLKGKWVFINYWASWCQPCLEEIPELNRFYKQHKNNKNVAIFAVNFDAPPIEEQKSLIEEFGIRYPALQKDPADELRLGLISGVPVTFVFNPEGKLMGRLFGGQTSNDLNAVLKAKS
ncbi:thiol-disulfide oxidoreductase ResA [Legionella adelaidensis]|uniref:Thiol-disulfide oxidoreductase ResA n=1 Tax=Legionella adelaidensis TaxID=45056 RepID=A0A0W0R144_9GAMM|nr:TlpA disulfide reductase family protein [Legionella adelaidensis]KTC64791.1 thiol-disulfide oxidoreductase ResA [Legionella adelaidensis]